MRVTDLFDSKSEYNAVFAFDKIVSFFKCTFVTFSVDVNDNTGDDTKNTLKGF